MHVECFVGKLFPIVNMVFSKPQSYLQEYKEIALLLDQSGSSGCPALSWQCPSGQMCEQCYLGRLHLQETTSMGYFSSWLFFLLHATTKSSVFYTQITKSFWSNYMWSIPELYQRETYSTNLLPTEIVIAAYMKLCWTIRHQLTLWFSSWGVFTTYEMQGFYNNY